MVRISSNWGALDLEGFAAFSLAIFLPAEGFVKVLEKRNTYPTLGIPPTH